MYIYIITHPSFEGWVKIGRTIFPKRRLDSYQTGCPNRDYVMNYICKTNRPFEFESYFKKYVDGVNEWYKCTIDEAIKIIDEIKQNEVDIKDRTIADIVYSRRTALTKYEYYIDGIKVSTLFDVANHIGITMDRTEYYMYKYPKDKRDEMNIQGHILKRKLICRET